MQKHSCQFSADLCAALVVDVAEVKALCVAQVVSVSRGPVHPGRGPQQMELELYSATAEPFSWAAAETQTGTTLAPCRALAYWSSQDTTCTPLL